MVDPRKESFLYMLFYAYTNTIFTINLGILLQKTKTTRNAFSAYFDLSQNTVLELIE